MFPYTTAKTNPIDPFTKMKDLGLYPSRGGNVVLDQFFTQEGDPTIQELAKYIIPGTTGDLVLETMDGHIVWEPNRPAGYYIVGVYRRVLTSATFSIVGLKSTTATNIVWRGGQ